MNLAILVVAGKSSAPLFFEPSFFFLPYILFSTKYFKTQLIVDSSGVFVYYKLMNIYWIVFAVVISLLTLMALSFSLYIFIFFKRLSKGIGRSDLIKILSKLSEIEKENSGNIKNINKVIDEIKNEARGHLQRVSLIRFNPFSEMGGDHSFSLAILDADLTGFIITGLHTRERTRVYTKKIENGKCKQDLSKEEKEALRKATL